MFKQEYRFIIISQRAIQTCIPSDIISFPIRVKCCANSWLAPDRTSARRTLCEVVNIRKCPKCGGQPRGLSNRWQTLQKITCCKPERYSQLHRQVARRSGGS